MAGMADTSDTDWPLRTWIFVLLGALLGLAMQQLSDLPESGWEWGARLVAAAFIFLGVSGVAFGLAWQRGRLIPAIGIALVCGIVAGTVLLWNGTPNSYFNGADGWHLFCGLVASVAMLTLFQAAQDRGANLPTVWSWSGLRSWKSEALHYADVHGHLWTNALTLGLGALFTGLSFGIAHLLSEMFWLVKLDFLRALLRKDWFNALLCGAAFGAALGLLRDRGNIISLLQRVAMIVLRVLAPVLAVGILVFLAALPFTGLDPLWDTGGTTPIMLGGALLALFLSNAVVSDTAEDESRSIVMRYSAAALGLVLLPMVGIAAFSSGLRIQQYGLSPDRLWALVFIVTASITAIAYAVTILGQKGWFSRLRRTNLRLVFVLSALTLILSTPLIGFERISTAHQLARLSGGQVSPENFDYRGLWFDFGPPGRAAIERLAASSSDATIRRFAGETKKLKERWDEAPNQWAVEIGNKLDGRLTILPKTIPLDEQLRKRLLQYDACGRDGEICILRYMPGQDYAVVIRNPERKCDGCKPSLFLLRLEKGVWSDDMISLGTDDDAEVNASNVRAGKVEMRTVQRRQLFIDGKPYGATLPLASEVAPPNIPSSPAGAKKF